jgi:23S rRNA (guanosine2251-2'-O)-methyltransferase
VSDGHGDRSLRPTAGGGGRLTIGGRRAVLESIRAGIADSVFVSDAARSTPGLRALVDEAAGHAVQVRRVSARELDAFGVRDHRGVVATVQLPGEMDDRALAGLALPADALVVLLDGIEDPQNLGACARSAEAAGACLLVVRRRRSADITPAAITASAGALLHLPVARVTNLSRTLEALGDRGCSSVGLDHRAEATIHEVDPPPRPLVVVVGAEGSGISRLVRERCDRLVRIPMPGRVGSLNASASLAAGLFGFVLRPRGAATKGSYDAP